MGDDKDRREFIRLSVDLPLHPKLASLDEEIIPLAGWLTVSALCYCGQNLTDGEFTPSVVYRLAGVGKDIGKELIAVGIWHESGHDCPACPQPGERKLIVHNFLRHQRSRSEAQALRSARADAGVKGAQKRWGKVRDEKAHMASAIASATEDAMASGIATAMANGWQADGKAMAEVEEEEEKEQTLFVPDNERPATAAVSPPAGADEKKTRKAKTEPHREDVERLCRLLFDLMTDNGVRKPAITNDWRREARLLLDRDEVAPKLAEYVLRWSQADQFWKTNILSMPTFREKFAALEMKAKAERDEAVAAGKATRNGRSAGRPGVPEGW